MSDPYDLERFVLAQNYEGAYGAAYKEIRRGRKSGHWMWFVFPQMSGLGRSFMSRKYAIHSLAEARAYLAHPILGDRLDEATDLLDQTEGLSAEQIFGSTDAKKLQSSMTLFARASSDGGNVFDRVLEKYFDGERDATTDGLVRDAQ
ncbi:MAG: calpastatin [Glaciihabitans sp.]|nr:calpastatin [Glaciihabitans sp.]